MMYAELYHALTVSIELRGFLKRSQPLMKQPICYASLIFQARYMYIHFNVPSLVKLPGVTCQCGARVLSL